MGCAEVPCSFGHKCNQCQGTQIFCSTFSLWTFLESAFLSVSFQYENFMYKQLKNNLFTTRLILFLQSECVSSYFQCSNLFTPLSSLSNSSAKPRCFISYKECQVSLYEHDLEWQPGCSQLSWPLAIHLLLLPCRSLAAQTLWEVLLQPPRNRGASWLSSHIQVALICFFALL